MPLLSLMLFNVYVLRKAIKKIEKNKCYVHTDYGLLVCNLSINTIPDMLNFVFGIFVCANKVLFENPLALSIGIF